MPQTQREEPRYELFVGLADVSKTDCGLQQESSTAVLCMRRFLQQRVEQGEQGGEHSPAGLSH